MTGSGTGRLLAYYPATGETKVLLTGMSRSSHCGFPPMSLLRAYDTPWLLHACWFCWALLVLSSLLRN